MPLPTEFRLEIVTPRGLVFAGQATSVIAPGTEGYLGVLPGHTPLITSLRAGYLSFVADGQRRRWLISSGYMEVTPRTVVIITESVEPENG